MTEVDKRTPLPSSATAISQEPKRDPFKNIPEMIEDRHREIDGSTVSNRFLRGNVLGKVMKLSSLVFINYQL